MLEIGQKVIVGNSEGTVIGYDYADGETFVGVKMQFVTWPSGFTLNHTSWYTADELSKYGIVPIRSEIA